MGEFSMPAHPVVRTQPNGEAGIWRPPLMTYSMVCKYARALNNGPTVVVILPFLALLARPSSTCAEVELNRAG